MQTLVKSTTHLEEKSRKKAISSDTFSFISVTLFPLSFLVRKTFLVADCRIVLRSFSFFFCSVMDAPYFISPSPLISFSILLSLKLSLVQLIIINLAIPELNYPVRCITFSTNASSYIC